MKTEDKFKNSPIHDKRAILEMMDELRPEQMVKVVDFIQEQVKLFCQPAVMPSLPNGKKVLKALKEWHDSFTPEELKEMFGNEA